MNESLPEFTTGKPRVFVLTGKELTWTVMIRVNMYASTWICAKTSNLPLQGGSSNTEKVEGVGSSSDEKTTIDGLGTPESLEI